jgi:hypothetical protein
MKLLFTEEDMILFLDENAQPKEATFLHQTICSTSNSEGPFVDLKFICFLDWFDGISMMSIDHY